jgi:hypothetical protein
VGKRGERGPFRRFPQFEDRQSTNQILIESNPSQLLKIMKVANLRTLECRPDLFSNRLLKLKAGYIGRIESQVGEIRLDLMLA